MAMGSSLIDPNTDLVDLNRLRNRLGRDVPFATELQGLDPAVLRRLTFGTMPLALGLEGEE